VTASTAAGRQPAPARFTGTGPNTRSEATPVTAISGHLAFLFAVVVWAVWQANQHKYYGVRTQPQAVAAPVPQPYLHTLTMKDAAFTVGAGVYSLKRLRWTRTPPR